MSSWLRNRDLNCLFVGQLISQIGDAMFHIGMLWLVLELTGSKSAMGTIAMLGYLPVLLLGIPAGIMADRMDRRRLMMAADLVRAAVVAVLLGLCLTSTVQLWMLLAVVIVLASASTPFNPARDAMVPDLVEGDDLLRANSAIQVTDLSGGAAPSVHLRCDQLRAVVFGVAGHPPSSSAQGGIGRHQRRRRVR